MGSIDYFVLRDWGWGWGGGGGCGYQCLILLTLQSEIYRVILYSRGLDNLPPTLYYVKCCCINQWPFEPIVHHHCLHYSRNKLVNSQFAEWQSSIRWLSCVWGVVSIVLLYMYIMDMITITFVLYICNPLNCPFWNI